MPTHAEKRALPYRPDQLFELVADIERYPEFLPWCRAARIRKREGDVIIAFDGKSVAGVDDLHRMLTDAKVGVGTALTILRWTEKLELRVVPEEAKN